MHRAMDGLLVAEYSEVYYTIYSIGLCVTEMQTNVDLSDTDTGRSKVGGVQCFSETARRGRSQTTVSRCAEEECEW